MSGWRQNIWSWICGSQNHSLRGTRPLQYQLLPKVISARGRRKNKWSKKFTVKLQSRIYKRENGRRVPPTTFPFRRVSSWWSLWGHTLHYCTNLSLKLKPFSPLLSSEWQNKCVCTFYCIFNVFFFSPDGRKTLKTNRNRTDCRGRCWEDLTKRSFRNNFCEQKQ